MDTGCHGLHKNTISGCCLALRSPCRTGGHRQHARTESADGLSPSAESGGDRCTVRLVERDRSGVKPADLLGQACEEAGCGNLR